MTKKIEHPGKKAVANWLTIGCVLIVCMVLIGGITRLTHSGLSMTDWKPIRGTVPPLNDIQWQEEFNRYRQFPEYQLVNYDMTLAEFKSIFFWEYLHRLWGRMMGLVFFIPFVIFIRKKYLSGVWLKKSIWILAGGAAVGGIGWFMVLSGLQNRPDVSHYRLALHLVAAFSLLIYIFWTLLQWRENNPSKLKWDKWGATIVVLTYIQIIYGAFVAGLDAGTIYNTYPLMNGKIIPENVFSLSPFWKNLLEHKDGVQFIHRTMALILAGSVVYMLFTHRCNQALKKALLYMGSAITIQFGLGVTTLLLSKGGVPVFWGVVHQLGAVFLLLTVVYFNFKLAIQQEHQ